MKKFLGVVAVLSLVAAVFPDAKRYLRIRNM